MAIWNELINELQSLSWHLLQDGSLDRIKELLRLAADHPHEILERFESVISRAELYDRYAPHMEYPRPVMDKFILYMDGDDRFRIRLHKFKAQDENRGVAPFIHDHRWHFVSVVLAGSYVENLYSVIGIDEATRNAQLKLSGTRRLSKGDVNVGTPLVPHLTINDSAHTTCYTLFIRGPSISEYSRIFDTETNSFRPSWGLRRELFNEIAMMKEGIALSKQESK